MYVFWKLLGQGLNRANFLQKYTWFLILFVGMTIGYLTNGFSSSYHITIWKGIQKACEERSVNFINFLGREFNSPNPDHFQRNKLFDIISKEYISGLIINAATLFHYASTEDMNAFYQRFRDIPVVNLGKKINDIPTVLVDNKNGIYDAMVHLIKDHGLKKIAFIKGPGSNSESELRYNAYKEALAEYGIKEDPLLVVTGDFQTPSGGECLEKILKNCGNIEAVVAANDCMALGVLIKAQELGIVVPNMLAIIGFDDIEEVKNILIPLTTVRPPLYNQAKKCVELLYDLIENRKEARDILLPTELVVRRSCGCFSETTVKAQQSTNRKNNNSMFRDLKTNSQIIIKQFKKDKGENNIHITKTQQRFLEIFIDYMEEKNPEKELKSVDMMLNQVATNRVINVDEWQNMLSELINIVSPYIINDPLMVRKAGSFFHQLRIMIYEMGFQAYKHYIFKNNMKTERLHWVTVNLGSIFDINELISQIEKVIYFFGAESYYLSLYENKGTASEYSRLILAYNNKKIVKIPEGGIRYKTKDLLPDKFKQSDVITSCIINALFFKDQHFGFLIFKTQPRRTTFVDLRQQISNALKGASLIQDIVDKEKKLKILLADQKERAKELENAYKTLQNNQKKMIITEKMASLGRMTAGIAHEMNTPLAAVRNAMVELRMLAEEIKHSIKNPEITIDDYNEIADDMIKSICLTKKAAESVVNYVHGIKAQTRDLSPKDHIIFNAIPVIQDSILLLTHSLQKHNCSVTINPENEIIELYGSPARLSQVITNLISNAINALKNKGNGRVHIDLSSHKNGIDIFVKDEGEGIKKEDLPKIFEPLFTTNDFDGGTGLGLAIVHNIMTGDFDGTIEVESTPGNGTVFILHFPHYKQYIQ